MLFQSKAQVDTCASRGPSFGIVSFNTNLTSMGANYSQNGGWSGNYMGMQFSQNGVSFSPSVGVGLELYYKDSSIEKNSVYSSNAKGNNNSVNTPITVYNVEQETEVWNFMQTSTNKNKTEYGALITSKKILVRRLPVDGGDLNVGLKHERILGKEYIVYKGERMKLIAGLHTHHGTTPDLNEFSYYSYNGSGSDYITASNHKGIIYYLMTENGNFRSMIYDGKSYNEGVISNVTSVNRILDGSVKLIPITKKIYNYFNR